VLAALESGQQLDAGALGLPAGLVAGVPFAAAVAGDGVAVALDDDALPVAPLYHGAAHQRVSFINPRLRAAVSHRDTVDLSARACSAIALLGYRSPSRTSDT
jgi:hypothetical protein